MEKINKLPSKINILVTPLDWGLGHATRCIPIINELITYETKINIAASGISLALLKTEFPQMTIIPIEGYDIKYSKKKIWLPFVLIGQLPKLFFRIKQERKWLKKYLKNNHIDIIISDNRLGLYHNKIKSIYITHQLKIKAGNKFFEWVIQKIHYYFINKFHQCWIPDNEGNSSLSGQLSNPIKLPLTPLTYIGPLSRLNYKSSSIKYDLLFIISGPEPQRTIFETLILDEIKKFTGTALIVRGLPHLLEVKNSDTGKIQIVNYLNTVALNEVISESELIISRSGYTTIMDLVKMQKKAIFIPTPGQTEQEYLAKYVMSKNYFYSLKQSDFCLENVLKIIEKDNFSMPPIFSEKYKDEIKKVLNKNEVD